MKNLSLKSFLLPTIVLMAIFIATILFLWPKIIEISDLRGKLVEDKKLLVQLTAKVVALEGLGETELKTKTEKAMEILPIDKNVPLILIVLKNLASQANVSLISSSVEPGELSVSEETGVTAEEDADLASSDVESAEPVADSETASPPLVFELALVGEKKDLENLVKEIEQVVPLMMVRTFTFSQDKSGDFFKASLSLESFFLPLPEKLGSIETPIVLLSPQEETVYQQLASFKSMAGIETLPLIQSGKENLFSF